MSNLFAGQDEIIAILQEKMDAKYKNAIRKAFDLEDIKHQSQFLGIYVTSPNSEPFDVLKPNLHQIEINQTWIIYIVFKDARGVASSLNEIGEVFYSIIKNLQGKYLTNASKRLDFLRQAGAFVEKENKICFLPVFFRNGMFITGDI